MVNASGSAKVTSREVDLTTRVPSFPGVYGAIAIPAKKGPINEPTLVTSDSQFLKRYTPNEKIDIGMDNSHFSALNFLQQSGTLWVNRVAVNALYSIMLYASARSELSKLEMSDEIGVSTTSDTIGVSASFNKYLSTGDIVTFTTDGVLPSPLLEDTNYYVIKKDNGTIQVADTYQGATSVKKTFTANTFTDRVRVGTPLPAVVDYATNDDRLTVTGHALASGDKIRLTPSPVAPIVFTVAYLTSDSILNFSTAHELVDGQEITVSTSGTLPTGLSASTTYYVTVVTSTSIRLYDSTSTLVLFTSNGTGTHQVDAGILPAPLNAKTFTITNAVGQTDMTVTGHGLVTGQQVRLSTTGTFPTASPVLNNSTFYYVIVVNSNTIQISLTSGGPAIVMDGTSGTGTYRVHPEIHYAIPLTANTLSIEPVIGSGAITFTNNGFGVHFLTKPHGIASGTAIQFESTGVIKKFTTSFSSSNKTFICADHGLENGTVVNLNNDKIVSDLPAGLSDSARYYVVNSTTNTFELSTTDGTLTQATFTDDGTGNHYFRTGILPLTVAIAPGGTALAFNTTYYAVSVGFDTFGIATTSVGSALNITDSGSGTLMFNTGFIDLTTTGTGVSYAHRSSFSNVVKSANFSTSYASNNRLLMDASVVSMLDTGTPVQFLSQGTLPSPLLPNTNYYVIKYPLVAPETQLQSYHTNSTTIKLATSEQNALDYSPTNDTSLILSSDGTGTHSIYFTRGLSEVVAGYEKASIVENFVINQDSLSETVIVPQKFGERLNTGDVVKFSTSSGGKLPLPLLPNTNYYVVKQSDTEFKVATTYANATAVTPVVLDLSDNISFAISGAVNPATDIITIPSSFGSQMTTGTPVTVSVVSTSSSPVFNVLSASDKLPKPLNGNTVYYWIKVSNTQFKLALTPNDAVLGQAIDLVDVGGGDEMLITIEGINKVTFVPSVDDPTAFSMGSDDILLFYSANQGVWGDDIAIRLEDYRQKESDAFLVKVFKKSNLNIPVESFVCSRKNKKDGRGFNIYIQDVLESSSYIRCYDNTLIDDDVFPVMSVATSTNPNVKFLVGGSDGNAVTEGHMIQGSEAFLNVNRIPVSVLMDGGWSLPAYQRALDAIARTRKDCVALLSTPFDKESSSNYLNDIVDYRTLDLNLNTSFSALYTPSPLVYDKFNDRRVYISPDGIIGALVSATAANYELWFPVAGFRRGLINVLDLRRRFSVGEQDYLYDNGINPIKFEPGKGIVVWGQKTLLSRPSALDRLNVRLLLTVIDPAIKSVLADFLFDLNDVATRGLVKSLIEGYLSGIQSRRGLSDYKVICDDSNNSNDDIDNHILNLWVFLKPIGSLEYIESTLVLTPTSVSFSLAESLIT